MKMLNRDKIDKWMYEGILAGHDFIAFKGPPPAGATYSDGDPVTNPVNVAWQDTTTGEVMTIEYDTPGGRG